MDKVKRIAIGVATSGFLMAGAAGFAMADQGGVPNDNACLGQATSEYAHTGPTSVGEAVKLQAQTGEKGRSEEVQAFKAANCP